VNLRKDHYLVNAMRKHQHFMLVRLRPRNAAAVPTRYKSIPRDGRRHADGVRLPNRRMNIGLQSGAGRVGGDTVIQLPRAYFTAPSVCVGDRCSLPAPVRCPMVGSLYLCIN
jgi:hypothetical protein